MAGRRKFRSRSRSSSFTRRNRKRKIHTIVEEIGEGDSAKLPPITPPRLTRTFALSCIASLIPSNLRSPSQSHSSPSRSQAKLDDEEDSDSQRPAVPAKLSKHDDRGVPSRKPPPPPSLPQPRSSSASRQEEFSNKLQKPESPIRAQRRDGSSTSASSSRRERASSLAPPISQMAGQSGTGSSPTNSRPTSYHSDQEVSKGERLSKRRSWLGLASRSRNISQDMNPAHLPSAWVELDGQKLDYNVSFLIDGQMVRNPLQVPPGSYLVCSLQQSFQNYGRARMETPMFTSSHAKLDLRLNSKFTHPRSPRLRYSTACLSTIRHLSAVEIGLVVLTVVITWLSKMQ